MMTMMQGGRSVPGPAPVLGAMDPQTAVPPGTASTTGVQPRPAPLFGEAGHPAPAGGDTPKGSTVLYPY